MTTSPAAIHKPRHPLHALTTYELRNYRRELETAIAFFAGKHPVPPAQAELQARLDAVTTEQAERAELTGHA